MIKKYLLIIGESKLFYSKNKIAFMYNASLLRFDDQTKIENVFRYDDSPKILVTDIGNIIGG